jgi:hypothetical protein
MKLANEVECGPGHSRTALAGSGARAARQVRIHIGHFPLSNSKGQRNRSVSYSEGHRYKPHSKRARDSEAVRGARECGQECNKEDPVV